MRKIFSIDAWWLVFAVACSMIACGAEASFEGVDVTKRNVTVAANIDEENVALSATTVIPGTAAGFTGFVANDSTKLAADWDIITRLQVSREIGSNWHINLFGEVTRRDSIGIHRQIASGFFVSKHVELGEVGVNIGAGNFVEREQERADLGLMPDDSNSVRGLVYAKAGYKNLSVLAKATPKVNGKDLRLLVKPTLEIGNGLSVTTEWFYDTDPAIENNNSDLGATVQMNVDF